MSLMRNSLTIGVVAFLAYCVYFDRKRRSDPEFKAKLKQKRLNAKRLKESLSESNIPILKGPSEMQAYFFQEVQTGDELIMNGNFEEGASHLANAAVVCSQKTEFLGLLQKTLPAPIFQLLLQNYHTANDRYLKKILSSGVSSNPSKQSFVSESKQFDETDIE